ncbi:NAD(P)H-hydrate dehydratase [bacterium]|nr:NAD(P)H-hydrate dehydratase [bacterium]
MLPLLSSEDMRRVDAEAITKLGIPGMVLMENAALAVVERILPESGELEDLLVAVVCGPGNTGGAGFAIARQLYLRGCDVDVFLLGEPAKLKGDALTNYRICVALEMPIEEIRVAEELDFSEHDLVIDAIFGTGPSREISGLTAEVIEALNQTPATVISVDVPSGVDASTGEVDSVAVWADYTVTFQYGKPGLYLPPGRDYAGEVEIAPISLPAEMEKLQLSPWRLPDDEDVWSVIPSRPRGSHKGYFGKLLIVAGSRGMSGAARLCAQAALRTGAGLVTLAVPETIRPEAAQSPELMTVGLPETSSGCFKAESYEALKSYVEWADVIAVGPGMGQDKATAAFLKLLLAAGKPIVIDADALNLISAHKLHDLIPRESILTPHPGEFSRLTGQTSVSSYERIETASRFAESRALTIVLKDAPSVCVTPDGEFFINPTGNAGLAKGGSGDVLTGVIAALRAQHVGMVEAAWAGVYLHGRAADLAVERIEPAALTARDVISHLSAAIASLRERPHDHSE